MVDFLHIWRITEMRETILGFLRVERMKSKKYIVMQREDMEYHGTSILYMARCRSSRIISHSEFSYYNHYDKPDRPEDIAFIENILIKYPNIHTCDKKLIQRQNKMQKIQCKNMRS